MREPYNRLLITGAALSALAALLHLACIYYGAPWYRALGAGEELAQLAEAGSPRPALITLGIALVLFGWSLYALSGAGVIRRLPLLRTALTAITAVYLPRGLVLVPALFMTLEGSRAFWLCSSAICALFGIVHAAGLRQVWGRLAWHATAVD